MKIYLAGKISKNDWRESLVHPGQSCMTWERSIEKITWETDQRQPRWGILPKSIDGLYDYVGPYFIGDDHGCGHGANSHGNGTEDTVCFRAPQRETVVNLCLEAINRADFVFAYLQDQTCYGSLVELGYAKAKNKPVYIAYTDAQPDLWFAHTTADGAFRDELGSPALALDEALQMYYRKLPYKQYLKTTWWQHVRRRELTFAGNRCRVCNSNHRLEVHHRTYENLGRESHDDVTVLCAKCHGMFHRNGRIAS